MKRNQSIVPKLSNHDCREKHTGAGNRFDGEDKRRRKKKFESRAVAHKRIGKKEVNTVIHGEMDGKVSWDRGLLSHTAPMSNSMDEKLVKKSGGCMVLKIRNALETGHEREKSHWGEGLLEKVRAFVSEDFETPIQFIDYVIVPPGASVGYHRHGDDEEVYFVIDGQGIMRDEYSEVTVKKGDIIVNTINGSHGLSNNTKENIVLLIFDVRHDRNGS